MSTTSSTTTNARLAVPRRLLENYLQEAAGHLARRRQVVGHRIREARELRGLKQKDLAARVNVEPQTVSNWERGVYEPDFDKIELLARELRQPASFFFSDEAAATQQPEVPDLVERRLEEIERHLDDRLDRIERLLRGEGSQGSAP